jgi:hypothetical protein
MNKKKIFTPNEILKSKHVHNMKHINQIMWYTNLDISKKITMTDFINFIQTLDIYTKIDLNDYRNHKIIGICPIGSNIINHNPEYIYLITDPKYQNLYISLGKSHPLFWYSFPSKKKFLTHFDQLYEIYNPQAYKLEYTHKIRGFIGTDKILSLNIHDLENHFLLNSFTEKLIWGSKWIDHPFRGEYIKKNVSNVDSILYTGQAMRQLNDSIYSVSVRTLYSKSIITINEYEGAFILEIKYEPIESHQINQINELFGRKYTVNLPIDVIITLINFPFMTHIELLKARPLTDYNFMMTALVIDNNKMYHELIPELNNIINDSKIDENIKSTATIILNDIKNNNILETILNDNNLYEMIDSTYKVADNKNVLIEKIISDLIVKYDCENNEIIKNELKDIMDDLIINY